jgi:hypothetical protein
MEKIERNRHRERDRGEHIREEKEKIQDRDGRDIGGESEWERNRVKRESG